MDSIFNWIVEHASHAHWLVFVGSLLAGLNIPVSIDILVFTSAILASRIVPENLWVLYGGCFFGCFFSAQIAYWFGRSIGTKLLQWHYFAKILPKKRLRKVQKFYAKYGLFSLIVGRFIPFGVRNAIFMSSGITKIPFARFLGFDLIACFIWTSICFAGFYLIGQSYETVKHFLASFYLLIFTAFGVTVISFIWYKKRKNKATL